MRRLEDGKGRLKALFALAVVAATVYLSIKIIPVYVNNYDLHNHIHELAETATVQHLSADKITKDVVAYADDLGLPITADNVKVAVGNIVTIDLDYTVPIDLRYYTLMLHFTPSAENRQL